MSANLPSLYAQQFSSNVELLLQQKLAKLRPFVTVGMYKGEQASPVDQIGSVSMAAAGSAFAAKTNTSAAVDRRWVLPADYELNQLIHSFDKLKMVSDPESAYVQNAVAAANRQIDSVIVSAFFGTAKTGKSGSTNTAFPAGNIIAASTTGLTLDKLLEGKKKLMANEVDMEGDEIICVVTSKQHQDLLALSQIQSSDFNNTKVLVDGKVTRFLGITFIHSELLGTNASSERQVPMYAKSGMHLGIWNDIENNISKRNDLVGEPWQLYTKLSIGATRIEEKKVIQIACKE